MAKAPPAQMLAIVEDEEFETPLLDADVEEILKRARTYGLDEVYERGEKKIRDLFLAAEKAKVDAQMEAIRAQYREES